jgi:TatA/E family protein of Tat protein translocase
MLFGLITGHCPLALATDPEHIMFGSIGMAEMVVIFLIALLVFGPRKLPELGKSLGRSLAEFRRASNELRNTLEDEVRIEEQREQAARAAQPSSAPTQPVAEPDQAAETKTGA